MGMLASLLRGVSWRQPGGLLSAGLHVGLVLASVMAFSSAKPFEPASEAVPIDVITDKQFNEMTQGDVKAKQQLATPQRRVDQVAETKREAEPGEAKKEVSAEPPKAKQASEPQEPKPEPLQKVAVAAPPPPRPPELRVKPPEPTPPAKVEEEEEEEDDKAELLKKITPKKPEPKKEEAKPEPPKPDPLAKILEQQKLDEKKRVEEKAKADAAAKAKAEADAKAKAKAEADKRAKEAKEKEAKERTAKEAAESKNLENSIQKLLNSKEQVASIGNTGAQIQRQSSQGAPSATGKRLSPSDRSQLVALLAEKIGRCFNNPGSAGPKTVPILRVQIGRDGSLITSPVISNNSNEPSFRSYADATLRATRSCAPYAIPARFLDTYEDWKNLQISLDLSDL